MENCVSSIIVTVIMPVYNSEKYIEQAVLSVLQQTYSYFELLLIDDGSSDHSFNICKKMEKLDARVKAIHKDNGGVCSARNLGIKLAKGQYIAFIDNDDLYTSDFLAVMLRNIETKNVDIIKCGRRNITVDVQGKQLRTQESSWKEDSVFDRNSFLENYVHIKKTGILNSVWNGLYKKEFVVENQLEFDESFRHGNEDVYFNLCCFLKCNNISIVKDVLYEHFYRDGHSTSMKFHEDQITTFIKTVELERVWLEPVISIKDYNLIHLRNIRLAFKLLAVGRGYIRQKEGIKLVVESLGVTKASNKDIIKCKNLTLIERVELFFIINEMYDAFFAFHSLKRFHRFKRK